MPGDGVGPEVTREALRVLGAAGERFGFALAHEEFPVGGSAIDALGAPLPESVKTACLASDAVLLGAVGGPAWDALQGDLRPEAGLLALRKALGAYANLRPVAVPDFLAGASPLRREVVAGTDMMIVRELTGGIYFSSPKGPVEGTEGKEARNTMRYSEAEIARIAQVAFTWARRRRGRVTSVDKANVLEVSQLWREVVTRVRETDYPDMELEHLYIDNAAMQIVRRPSDFDVVVTANLFGDILSDLAATLPGSLGLLPSASVGGSTGLFEPVHGSAPDIAGQGKANPSAAILSAAMMLEQWGEADAARAIRRAVNETLAEGARTADMREPGCRVVSTGEMGARVASRVRQETGREQPVEAVA